ncbi:putative dehydrogenase [Paenibacillus phyllosphaerae]|uniref:Putative dehydrogenase n=1 Tax=Paenibacillus phyllosphaerae TaxID=274593 RepID=A0A7W5AYR0_9BACL|nr:Gfo/Idh/MocA family oxidoreductase [Paenibacillus phyllosphaerae]MBB3111229.1 putative dehydrogenase [Paenibacillus phyllosphaerae]
MIRFGIIGTNTITEKFIQAARQAEGAAIAAVYSRKEETAAAYADKHGIEHRFTSLDAMLASDAIDAVYIASPTAYHMQHAIACMDAGKHVLCEKPVASNDRELKLMIEAAERNQVLFMEAMKSTLTPAFAAIAEQLPKIGKVRRYFASYCQYSSRYDAYKRGEVMNAFKPDLSNGALMDIGVYGIYPAVVLFGQPTGVKAEAYMLESGVDGEGSMILKYEDMDAVIMYSKITNSLVPSEIQGENGNILIDQISEPRQVRIHYRDGRVEDISVAHQIADVMMYEIQEFVNLIRSGKTESTVNSHANSLAVQGIMTEARQQFGLVFPADAR